MPFRTQVFLKSLDEHHLGEEARATLEAACAQYLTLTTPLQKARCIHGMMEVLDCQVDEATRCEIMQSCGRQCISEGTLGKARSLQKQAADLDGLLDLLNRAGIGGGHLVREGNVIHAAYERCYCGSVSQAKEPLSSTYCHCSCGWYHMLFETLLDRPVKIELLNSIAQGDERCRFLIHI